MVARVEVSKVPGWQGRRLRGVVLSRTPRSKWMGALSPFGEHSTLNLDEGFTAVGERGQQASDGAVVLSRKDDRLGALATRTAVGGKVLVVEDLSIHRTAYCVTKSARLSSILSFLRQRRIELVPLLACLDLERREDQINPLLQSSQGAFVRIAMRRSNAANALGIVIDSSAISTTAPNAAVNATDTEANIPAPATRIAATAMMPKLHPLER